MTVKYVALVASAALAASTVLLVAQPASAALVTRCTGVAGAVTVPGDLVVPRGQSCTLEGTTVLGNVRVQADADLLTDGAVLNGEVLVIGNGYVELVGGTTVARDVRARDAYGLYVEDSSIGGRVLQWSISPADRDPFVLTFGADAGSVDSRTGELLLESSLVRGNVSSRSSVYTDVIDSTVRGNLTVMSNPFGSVVCESEIYGPAVFQGNGATLQIGGSGAVGPCDGASFWGGNVAFSDNRASDTGFDISNNIVAGNLTGANNDPLPTGSGNRVRGEITLPFADAEAGQLSLLEQSEQSVQRQSEAEDVAKARVDLLRAKIAERRGVAEVEASLTPESQVLVPERN